MDKFGNATIRNHRHRIWSGDRRNRPEESAKTPFFHEIYVQNLIAEIIFSNYAFHIILT